MTELMQRYLEREKERGKAKEKITDGLDYIKWLAEFTETHLYFTTDFRNEKNTENIESLDLLYEVIDNYARSNYKYPYKTNWGYFYVLEYEGNYYKIGYENRESQFYYCHRITEENYQAISFLDVIEGKIKPDAALIDFKLKELRLILTELRRVLPEEKMQLEVAKVYRKQ